MAQIKWMPPEVLAGRCYDRLPVSFPYRGKVLGGYLDTKTLVLEAEAKIVSCETQHRLYIATGAGGAQRVDMVSGKVEFIAEFGKTQFPVPHDDDSVGRIQRYTFLNKAMANLSEIYSTDDEDTGFEPVQVHIDNLRHPIGTQAGSDATGHGEIGTNLASGFTAYLYERLATPLLWWFIVTSGYTTLRVLIWVCLPEWIRKLGETINVWGLVATRLARRRRRRQRKGATGRPGGVLRERDPRIEMETRFDLPDEEPEHRTLEGARPPALIPSRPEDAATSGTRAIVLARQPTPLPQIAPPRPPRQDALTPYQAYVADCASVEMHNARVYGELNGKRASILVDTGSVVSLCDQAAAQYFGIRVSNDLSADPIAITGVNGGVMTAIGQGAAGVRIGSASIQAEIQIFGGAVGHHTARYDLILGCDAIRRFGPVVLDIQSGRLSLPGPPPPSFVGLAEEVPLLIDLSECELPDPTHLAALKHLLERYSPVFARHKFDIGACTLTAPTIETTGTIPTATRPRPVPAKYKMELDKLLTAMLQAGIIVRSTTPWISFLVLVMKDNGELRTCVDFRVLNSVTVRDPYPFPRVKALLETAAGHDYYSSLDLAQGFWQIRLDATSSWKCGFITEAGVFAFTRLPFGLKNAPGIFCRLMASILEGLEGVVVYVDDLLIFADTVEEHQRRLAAVLQRLNEAGLKVKPEKCRFLRTTIEFLGHTIDRHGYRPSHSHTTVIENYPAPRSAAELHRYVGLTGYFRSFVPRYAEIVSPLNGLLKKGAKFEWGREHEQAFTELKRCLMSGPILRPPDYEAPFHLFCDASGRAMGAALMQQARSEDQLHVVSYCSRRLTPVEARQSATQVELGAIVYAIQQFRHLLYGCRLVVHTDHRPLAFLFNHASTNAKVSRWLLLFQELMPAIGYVRGKENKVADALSRLAIPWSDTNQAIAGDFRGEAPYVLAVETRAMKRRKELAAEEHQQQRPPQPGRREPLNEEPREDEVHSESDSGAERLAEVDKPLTGDDVRESMTRDRLLQKVLQAVRSEWATTPAADPELAAYRIVRRDLTTREGVLFKGSRIVVPETLRDQLLQHLHASHTGIVKMKSVSKRYFWWPGVGQNIEAVAAQCEACNELRAAEPRVALRQWPLETAPMMRLHLDFAGPLQGINYLLAVDAFSGYPFARVVRRTTTAVVTRFLRDIFTTFGLAKAVVSDNGPQFTAQEFKCFVVEHGIKHVLAPPYHPRSNGLCERFVQTLKRGVVKLREEGNGPEEAVRMVLFAYRSTEHCSTQQTPAALFLGREMITRWDALLSVTPRVQEARSRQKEGYDVHTRDREFESGDPVWMRDDSTHKPKWVPVTLIEARGEAIYRVEMESGRTRTAHLDQLRHRIQGVPPPEALSDSGETTTEEQSNPAPSSPPLGYRERDGSLNQELGEGAGRGDEAQNNPSPSSSNNLHDLAHTFSANNDSTGEPGGSVGGLGGVAGNQTADHHGVTGRERPVWITMPEVEEVVASDDGDAVSHTTGIPGGHQQLFVRSLTGKSVAYLYRADDDVRELIQAVSEVEGVPLDQLRIQYGGRQLQAGATLAEYGIGPNSSLDSLLRLQGGTVARSQVAATTVNDTGRGRKGKKHRGWRGGQAVRARREAAVQREKKRLETSHSRPVGGEDEAPADNERGRRAPNSIEKPRVKFPTPSPDKKAGGMAANTSESATTEKPPKPKLRSQIGAVFYR